MTEKQSIYLGALLHDIGKFAWRSRKIKAGVTHESLGEEFIREHLSKIACLKNHIDDIIKAHNRQLGKIWKADIVSSGEREDSEDKAPRRYLEPITNRVKFISNDITKTKSQNYWFYKPLPVDISLENENSNFPENSRGLLNQFKLNEEEYINIHEKYWLNFLDEIKLLPKLDNVNTFLDTFYKLLEKYTSKVLSAGYLSHPDISLFDHARMVAAISICMEYNDEKFLLLKGDITGIQNFIYRDIKEISKISKRLRSRSLIVSLLTEIIAKHFLSEFELELANQMYIGGGHFYLLIPYSKENLTKLNSLNESINGFINKKFKGNCSLTIAYKECSYSDYIKKFDIELDELNKIINSQKFRKSSSILSEIFKENVLAKDYGEFLKSEEKNEIKIGEILPKIKYIVFVKSQKVEKIQNISCLDFSDLNSIIYFIEKPEDIETIVSVYNSSEVEISKINDTNFIKKEFSRDIFNNSALSFRFIGNYIPKSTYNIPLSFEEISEFDSPEYPLLGFLRMDVDNLGAIFKYGLKEESDKEKKYTPSRIASLSRELNNFFTGFINDLACKYNIYLAYSGGDDVFAVGSWLSVCKFSIDLRKTFHKFVCENNNLSVSAGIVFTKPNYPISSASKLSEVQEKNAKNTSDPLEKDKVSLFDIQLNWDEFEKLIEWGLDLSVLIDDNNENEENKKILPRSFVHSLLNLTKKSFKNNKIDTNEYIKSQTKILYQFARKKITSDVDESNYDKKNINKKFFELAVRFLNEENKQDFYKKFEIPASIILYKTRK